MSVKALKWARTQMPRQANGKPYGIAKAVLFQLCDMADDKGYCWPGQATLSKLTGFGVTSVATALVTLDNDGYLARTEQRHRSGARQGQRTSDIYKLRLQRPPDDLLRGVTQPAALKSAAQRQRRERDASSQTSNQAASGDTEDLAEAASAVPPNRGGDTQKGMR